MCGRFAVGDTRGEDWADWLGVDRDAAWPEPSWNVAPTQTAGIVGKGKRGRGVALARWGLIPRWAKDRSFGSKTFNARSETIAEKPSFRVAYRKRRCLVPSNGFYEWEKRDRKKQPWYFHLPDQQVFAFAGLWEDWLDPESQQNVRSFTVLTLPANADLERLHHRMPLILETEQRQAAWLAGAHEEPAQPPPEPQAVGTLDTYPVSMAVNRGGFEDPSCIEPMPAQGDLF